jgi:hypothetical protein
MIRRDENGHVHFGRWLDFILQALIVVNLITLALETLPNLSEAQIYWLEMIEVVSIAIFTVEYLARCCAMPCRFTISSIYFRSYPSTSARAWISAAPVCSG